MTGTPRWVGSAVVMAVVGGAGLLLAAYGPSNPETGGAPSITAQANGGSAVVATFDGAEGGALDGDRPFIEIAGGWANLNGEAAVVEAPDSRRAIAITNPGAGEGSISVTMSSVVDGAGLVFRYVDPFNYWAVVAVPELATWNVQRVDDGARETVGNLGLSTTENGTVVSVVLLENTIDVAINGRSRLTLDDPTHAGEGRTGLVVGATDALDARWDDLVVIPVRRAPATPNASTVVDEER